MGTVAAEFISASVALASFPAHAAVNTDTSKTRGWMLAVVFQKSFHADGVKRAGPVTGGRLMGLLEHDSRLDGGIAIIREQPGQPVRHGRAAIDLIRREAGID
jgi:hypothetical protein